MPTHAPGIKALVIRLQEWLVMVEPVYDQNGMPKLYMTRAADYPKRLQK